MACRDEPPRSFKLVIAALTISAVLGWVGATFALGLDAFAFLGVATTGVATAAAESAIFRITFIPVFSILTNTTYYESARLSIQTITFISPRQAAGCIYRLYTVLPPHGRRAY